MRALIDTNVLIALEPTSVKNREGQLLIAAEFSRLAQTVGWQIVTHPVQERDLDNDKDGERRALRKELIGKYPKLEYRPKLPASFESFAVSRGVKGNDAIDAVLLDAIETNAAHYLITNDLGIHKKAARVKLQDRILTVSSAVALLRQLAPEPKSPPPAVELVKAYNLDRDDPIWESFRSDYIGFDAWFTKCQLEERTSFLVESSLGYEAVAIVNREVSPPPGLQGAVLKICSFKVAERSYGRRLGELLLRAIFDFAVNTGQESLFIELFPKQEQLILTLETFGFEKLAVKQSGELVYEKPMKLPPNGEQLKTGLSFHSRFGPRAIDWDQPVFIVPIQPRYERMLFPGCQPQRAFFGGEEPYGNSIRKVYVCNSPITKISEGAVLLFYRSEVESAITVVGVAEDTLRTSDVMALTAYASKLTVFPPHDLEAMTARGALAIKFRFAHQIEPAIRLQELRVRQVLSAAPQSIGQVSRSLEWLKSRINQSH